MMLGEYKVELLLYVYIRATPALETADFHFVSYTEKTQFLLRILEYVISFHPIFSKFLALRILVP